MNDRRPISERTGLLCAPYTYDFTAFDALLEDTPGIDAFCSSAAWSESARRAFMPHASLMVYNHGEATAVFAVETSADGKKMLLPLDATWTLGCPMASANPQRDIVGLIEHILEDRHLFDFIMLSGMRPNTAIHRMTFHAITKNNLTAVNFKPANRCIATIYGGVDPWLSRRSSKFRASIRRSLRDTEAAGIHYRCLPPDEIPDDLIEQLIHIERRSWKGLSGTGLVERTMAVFCRELLTTTTPRGQTRVIFAMLGDEVVGFIFGAVSQGRYRGVQMSVDHRLRSIGLGNALQVQMIDALAKEDVLSYDLGSAMPYKTRWADLQDRTISILIGPLRSI